MNRAEYEAVFRGSEAIRGVSRRERGVPVCEGSEDRVEMGVEFEALGIREADPDRDRDLRLFIHEIGIVGFTD